jgi:hypothetical protein
MTFHGLTSICIVPGSKLMPVSLSLSLSLSLFMPDSNEQDSPSVEMLVSSGRAIKWLSFLHLS